MCVISDPSHVCHVQKGGKAKVSPRERVVPWKESAGEGDPPRSNRGRLAPRSAVHGDTAPEALEHYRHEAFKDYIPFLQVSNPRSA